MSVGQMNGQNVSIKSIRKLDSDLKAMTKARTDEQGKKCALVKVDIVGVDDLKFSPAVGETPYELGQYLVYIPEDTKVFQLESVSKDIKRTINFEDYGIQIDGGTVYNIVLSTDGLQRTATFWIEPNTAKIQIDGKDYILDKDGKTTISITPTEHQYTITSNGYHSKTGKIPVGQDPWSDKVSLEPILHLVLFNVSPISHKIFVDNVPYNNNRIMLSEGNHELRIVADGYDDYNLSLNVSEKTKKVDVKMKKSRVELIMDNSKISGKRNIRTGQYYTLGAGFGNENFSSLGNGDAFYLFLGYSPMFHFCNVMAFSTGFNVGGWFTLDNPIFKEYYEEDESDLVIYFDAPLQLGLSFPFGKYNQHLFSILGGGYGSCFILDSEDEDDEDEGSIQEKWDYGLRLSTKFDLSHFSLGFDVSKSLNGMGVAACVTIAYKFYKKIKTP